MSDNHPNTFGLLKGLLWNGREDALGAISIAQRVTMDGAMQENIRRQFALSDAQMKKCNPDYEPPSREDDMGTSNFFNLGIMGDETVNKITQMLEQGNNANVDTSAAGQDGGQANNQSTTDANRGFDRSPRQSESSHGDGRVRAEDVGAVGEGGELERRDRPAETQRIRDDQRLARAQEELDQTPSYGERDDRHRDRESTRRKPNPGSSWLNWFKQSVWPSLQKMLGYGALVGAILGGQYFMTPKYGDISNVEWEAVEEVVESAEVEATVGR